MPVSGLCGFRSDFNRDGTDPDISQSSGFAIESPSLLLIARCGPFAAAHELQVEGIYYVH
jgi:hypothetical protein